MVNMIIYAGFEPVFIDNEENSFKTNSINVLEKYKNDVAAIVVTHLNGFNEDVLKIKEYTKIWITRFILLKIAPLVLVQKKTMNISEIWVIFLF